MSDNKRVSQLVEITAAEVAQNDLFYIIDTSAREGKKIQSSQLGIYLSASGSIFAFHAQQSDTASYVDASNVHGTVGSASYATTASNSNTASYAFLAANVVSASYAQTSSWAINAINAGSTLVTGSTYPITASWATNTTLAKTASLALSVGTASYVVSSSHANQADVATTASFFITHISSVDTASFALNSAVANVANTSVSTSYLVFSTNNGTASHALTAGSAPSNGLINYGMFLALEQSSSFAQLDSVVISSSLGTAQSTMIEAIGTAVLAYTASVYNTSSLSLIILNRLSGITQSLDDTQILYNVSSILNNWNSLSTGSIKMPFSLIGQSSLFGDYLLQVTSSFPNLTLDNRNVRFIISSLSDHVTINTAENIDFFYSPTQSYVTFSTIASSNTYYDTLPGLLTTGSINIKTIDALGSNDILNSITSVKYTWKCTNLTDFSCSSNPLIFNLAYSFPNTMSNLYCESCSISSIADLSNTQMNIFKCGKNSLTSIPSLPNTVTNLNCSNNLITNLSSLPSSLRILEADNNSISNISDLSFPVNLLTASLSNNFLSFIPNMADGLSKLIISDNTLVGFPSSSLPPSMSYLDMSSCSVFLMPTMSYSMSYLNISANPNLTTDQIKFVTSTLVSNGFLSGSFISVGFGAPTVPIYNDLVTLSASLNWTIQYDSFP